MTTHPAAQIWFPVPIGLWEVLCVASVVACVTDLRSMRIPNWLTLPLLLAGLAHGAWVGSWAGFGQALAGALIAGGIFIVAYAIAGGGAGDAKMMMALGACLGIHRAVLLVLGVTVAGFFWAIIIAVYRGGLRDVPMLVLHSVQSTRVGFYRLLGGRASVQQPVPAEAQARFKGWYPYAPAICAGMLGTWIYWEKFGSVV